MTDKKTKTPWSDDELLYALDAHSRLGWSARQIGDALFLTFGSQRSRLAVIGALNRIFIDDANAHGIDPASFAEAAA